MKIGVITLPLFTNYGGILQAYALQKGLQTQTFSGKKQLIAPPQLFRCMIIDCSFMDLRSLLVLSIILESIILKPEKEETDVYWTRQRTCNAQQRIQQECIWLHSVVWQTESWKNRTDKRILQR